MKYMNERVKVLILIVTYNGRDEIRQCLNSIDYDCYNVMVVDNASTDDTLDIIRKEHPKTILRPQSNNLGFGQANNVGLKEAIDKGYDYVLLLNQDAWLEEDTVERLIACHKHNSDYWIISPLQRHSRLNKIEPQFYKYLIKYNIDMGQDGVQETEYANAAIWLMPISTINIIGGFDSLFPHYGEDDDYLRRVHYWGGKIGILASAIAYHDRNISERKYSFSKLVYLTHLVYLKELKNLKKSYLSSILYTTFFCLWKSVCSLAKLNCRMLCVRMCAYINAVSKTAEILEHKEISKTQKAFL